MTIDHLPGSPVARFSNANYGPMGFFTAALGFVFLSGLVAGLVYDNERVVRGTRAMVRRILRRAAALYLTQMILFVALLAAVLLHVRGSGQWHLDLFEDAPRKALVLSGILLYEPDYLGILPMYILFLLVAPLVLVRLHRNLRVVLVTSALLWIVSGLLIHLPTDPDGAYFGALNPLCYQFLFILGLAFGAKQLSIERLPARARTWLIRACFAVAAVCLALRVQYGVRGPLNPAIDGVAGWLSDVQLGPLRLLNFAAFGIALYWGLRSVPWGRINSVGLRWLAFVGRHSLPVFAWSIVTAYAAAALLPHPSHAVGLALLVLATASLTIPAQIHAMIPSQGKRSNARSSEVPWNPRSSRAHGR